MNDEWQTPDDLFDKLNEEFRFNVDLCTDGTNSKCDLYITDIENYAYKVGRSAEGSYWMNPPYSRGKINSCMQAAYTISLEDNTVVCLVRHDPSAGWFRDWVNGKAAEIRQLPRRVKFKGADSAYNFPCCIVVYDGRTSMEKLNYWDWKD